MYGLLLENLAEYIRTAYGDDKWEEVRRLAHVDMPTFSTRRVYSDCVIPRLAHKATKVLGVTEKEFFEGMGVFFIEFVGQYGYDRVMSVLGRHMRDFLNGLDNLHEYLKFSYPRMKAPSFICENENELGLTLHYRSKRQGYVYYTIGQIKAVGRRFYSTDVRIELVHEEMMLDTVHVTFQLYFENTAYLEMARTVQNMDRLFPVQPSQFLDIFPFCVVFGPDMIVRNIGHSLEVVLPSLVGANITDAFNLNRPLIDFTWATVLIRTNNIFELVTMEPLHRSRSYELLMKAKMQENGMDSTDDELDIMDEDNISSCLNLKGQMLYMEDWKSIIFLGTPIMQDLEAMMKVGLYLNDLSMHDFSRDLMLAGTQQSVELKLALDQEQQKSKRLEDSMKKLDDEMRRTDELLYQMIPKAVADRLRKGAEAVTTCEVFDCVTILFSDVVTFTQICSRITPMEVVSLLNSMYSVFDQLTSKHQVYKVETIGDAYMVVSGAPEKHKNHADKICSMALDMRTGVAGIQDPSTGDNICIRIGVHSGTVVAGVVGLKMPRYCLFGDTVNTASRMESTSESMKIHISESTSELLHKEVYELVERGIVEVKGKGSMKTFYLIRRLGPLVDFSDEENNVDANVTAVRKASSPVDVPNRSTSPEERFSPGVRSLYSPVTLDDVNRHRQASPFKQQGKSWNGTTTSQMNQPPPPPPATTRPTAAPPRQAPPANQQNGDDFTKRKRGEDGRGWVNQPPAVPASVPQPTPAPPSILTSRPSLQRQDSKKPSSTSNQQPVGRVEPRNDDQRSKRDIRPPDDDDQRQRQNWKGDQDSERNRKEQDRRDKERDRRESYPARREMQRGDSEERKQSSRWEDDDDDGRDRGRRSDTEMNRREDERDYPARRDATRDGDTRGRRWQDDSDWERGGGVQFRNDVDPPGRGGRQRWDEGRGVRWRDNDDRVDSGNRREYDNRNVDKWRRASQSRSQQERPGSAMGGPVRRTGRSALPTVAGLFPCLNRMVVPSDSGRSQQRPFPDSYDPAEGTRKRGGADDGYSNRTGNSNSVAVSPLREKFNGVRSTYCVLL